MLFCENHYQYSWRFGNIFYTKKGSGSPVLLIHELKSTGSAAEWNSVINDLAKDHTVYALDLIGCGRSEKPKMTYTNYIYVQLINDFVKDVIGTKTDLVTSGSSSSIAIMSCYSEPGLYHRLMLVNPPSMKVMSKYPKANHKTLKYLMEVPLIGTTLYNLIHSRAMLLNNYKKSLMYPNRCMNKTIDTIYEASHLAGPASRYFYASERSHFTNINMLHALKKLNHSICIIGGEAEKDIEDIMDAYVFIILQLKQKRFPAVNTIHILNRKKAFLSLCSVYLS